MPVSESGFIANLAKLPVEVSRIDGRSLRRREDEARIDPLCATSLTLAELELLVLEESDHHHDGQIDRASAAKRLGIGGDERSTLTLELTRDPNHARLTVEVSPH